MAGGVVYRYSTAGPVVVGSGLNALSPGAPVVFSAQLNQQLYFADGAIYAYYDAPTDSVKAWTASSGSLPKDSAGNCPRLIERWRNRIVLSGLKFDPQNWFMSAVGDATNFNYNPSPALETQAVAGNNTNAGATGDIVTCLIPYSDEILVFGGSHTVYQLTGDPAAGGRIDLVSDSVGMAFGRPWCRDGSGVVYFLSSRGSVYRYVPGGLPERISDPVAELLLTANLGTNLCRMAWDERQRGFHVWFTPTQGTAVSLHYFYDAVNGAWWQDQYANASHNPLAVCQFQADDPTQRQVLLGGRDGFIRFLDPTAADDDGTAINSFVFLPVDGPGDQSALTVADLQCDLDSSSGTINYAVQGASKAQDALNTPTVTQTGSFSQGRNRSQPVRVFGQACWVKLASLNQAGNTWALEWLAVRLRVAKGSARQRIF